MGNTDRQLAKQNLFWFTVIVLGCFALGYAQAAVDVAVSGTEFRPIDGRGNNVAHPDWGTPGSQLLRGTSGSRYADGRSAMAGPARPSPRVVSNAVFAQTAPVFSSTGLSDYIWTWGQFLDHDISLTEGANEAVPVAVPKSDAFFDPAGTGTALLPFKRSVFDPETGTTGPRQQLNELTGFIDGSMVYGSSPARANWLRSFDHGRLKVTHSSVGDLLPYNDGTQPNAGSPEKPDLSTTLFVGGDIRVNEQPTLACMHTLFVREHNRQAGLIAAAHPEFTDEQIYQNARRTVVAEIQNITYSEFIPALLGKDALGAYKGYDPTVNAGVNTAFSTAAYRLGHTLLSPVIQRVNEDGSSIPDGPLSLRAAFFNATPPILVSEGIEPLLRGVAAQRSQELDAKVIDDVRNFLFGAPGAGGLDLITLNLQRGRDHGLPDFNTLRSDYGLPTKTTFAQISADPAMAAALEQTYHTVNDIDAFAGIFAEDDLPGQIVGETLNAVLVDQFTRSRAGDRFWFERTMSGSELAHVKSTTLADIVKLNTTIRKLQNHIFFVRGEGNGGT